MKIGSSPKDPILVVEDQPEVARAVRRVLSKLFDVTVTHDVPSAMASVKKVPYQLILLDIMLPKVSGYWLCQRLKTDVFLRHIPVIFLTGMDSSEDMVNGLTLGADDYLSKPFKADELIARSKAAIRRSTANLEANPLTRLPGNCFIDREIRQRLQSGGIFSILYLDIDNFKPYNDYYGFHRGDQVIGSTAKILIRNCPPPRFCVGHLGGDDFISIMQGGDPVPCCQAIIHDFEESLPQFYDPADFQRKTILTRNRQGMVTQFPLLSLSIGVVTNRVRPLRTLGEIAAIGAELKAFAKRKEGSNMIIDRRTEPYESPQKEQN